MYRRNGIFISLAEGRSRVTTAHAGLSVTLGAAPVVSRGDPVFARKKSFLGALLLVPR